MPIYTLDWSERPPGDVRSGAITIGNFDGVHLGHAALVDELRQQARAVGGPGVVVTFDPHPLKLLRPELFQPVLTTPLDRGRLLIDLGAGHVVLLRTTPELLQLTAEEFFQVVIQERLAARAIVEGANFRFGRGRGGDIDTLTRLGKQAGIRTVVVPSVLSASRPVSSSRVREALLQGTVREAAVLLRRAHRLRGTVVTGRQRGQTLGFPTANLEKVETLIPGDGVYAVKAYVGLDSWPGAANIGPNPTFGEQARKVEVHLIGYEGDLRGQEVEIDFLERLRDTRAFQSAEELVDQLRRDVARAEDIARSQDR
jgi:riboflavin kinase/FMN adenylyltransferase